MSVENMTQDQLITRVKANEFALKCLVSSLMSQAKLDANGYIQRLESFHKEPPESSNREIFQLMMQHYIDDAKHMQKLHRSNN